MPQLTHLATSSKIYHVRAIQADSVQELVIFDFRKEEEKGESNNCHLLIMAYMTTQVND